MIMIRSMSRLDGRSGPEFPPSRPSQTREEIVDYALGARFDFLRSIRCFRRSLVTRLFAASGVGCSEGFDFSRVGF